MTYPACPEAATSSVPKLTMYSTLAGALGEEWEAQRTQHASQSIDMYDTLILTTSSTYAEALAPSVSHPQMSTYDVRITATCQEASESVEAYATPAPTTYVSYSNDNPYESPDRYMFGEGATGEDDGIMSAYSGNGEARNEYTTHPEASGTSIFAGPSTGATSNHDFEGGDWDALACHQGWPTLQGAKISEDSTLADALVERAVGKTDEQQQPLYIYVERWPTALASSGVTAAPYSTLTGALGEREEAKISEEPCPSTAISTTPTLPTSPASGDRTTSLLSTHQTSMYDLPISSTCHGALEAVQVYAIPESTYASYCDLAGLPLSSTAQPTGYGQPQDGIHTGALASIEAYDTPILMVTPSEDGGSISPMFSASQITPMEGWGEVQTGESLAYPYVEIDNQFLANLGSFVRRKETADADPYHIDLRDKQDLNDVVFTDTGLGGTWNNGVDQLYVPEAEQAQEDSSYIPTRKWPAHLTNSLQQPLHEAEEYAAVTNQRPVWPAQGIGSFGDTHEPYSQFPEFQASTPGMSQSTAPGNQINQLTEHSEQPAGSTSALPQSVAAPSSWGKSTSRGRQCIFRFYRPPQSTAERPESLVPVRAPTPKQRKRPRKIEGIISIGVRDKSIRHRCVFKGVSVDVLDGDSMEGWGRRNDIMLQRYEGEYQPCVLEFKYRQHGQAIRVNLNETNDTIRVRDLARMIARHFGRWCRESDAQRRAVCQQLGHPSDQSGVCECGREPTPMENIILTSIEQRGNHFTGVFVDR
ncbi:hypothetical protein GLOTRDRAFT_133886 [Gloeophyllum trabeum ATCC 11539]|uniref:Uncharacterized protein n=1 Tax=Gloeophyllum trabeum (strain ATCC 11539 / FP-39264 / Madison 617) TaxID=670483 RepID=S7PRT8_GLOTA|nr:uncharacterized protein GLOTRDRAFT_133886 [Gloeophyllum trabeum ATCC 11539]EPQ50516.1 hypothetical protein GLOTRDRAFT_133886 [Gloeophyllum trabeum ATCC 11539]